ncbi:MAG: hypothetical protein IPG76_23720 [Acidobacteria bacterium]|nr:hypothetical protein [Acidobacteriota bacterium]
MSPTSYQTAPPRVNETLTLLVAGYFVNNPANFFIRVDVGHQQDMDWAHSGT